METKDENQEKEVLSEEELNKVNGGGVKFWQNNSNPTTCENIKSEATCMNNPECVWRVVTGFFATLFSWFGWATSYCHNI